MRVPKIYLEKTADEVKREGMLALIGKHGMVNLINVREGYRTIEICSPMEVIYDE